jgi:cell division septum initiation protein DivIVA
MRIRFSIGCVAVLTLLCSSGAQAQVSRSGGGSGASAQLMQQYQQVLTERTQLQTDNAKLKKDLDDAKQQLAAAKRESATLTANSGKAQAEVTAAQMGRQNAEKVLEALRTQAQQLVNRFRDTVATLRGVETERGQLQQQLAQRTAQFDNCVDRNVQLFQINTEVLSRLQHQSVFTSASKMEPFTRITRTRLDNLVLEDRERVDELRVEKDKPASATASDDSKKP